MFQQTETDDNMMARIGIDPVAWAREYMKMPHDREYPDRLHPQLTAWFANAINAGRHDALSIGSGPEARKALIGRCADEDCKHRWVVVWLPMEMIRAATVMQRATCPLCGNTSVGVGSSDS